MPLHQVELKEVNVLVPFPLLPCTTETVVQLVWSLDMDAYLKGWICGVTLCHMAAAAGRLQVCRALQIASALQPVSLLNVSCISLTFCMMQESRQHGQDKHDWANRCITLATLGIQILNHPGTALQATLPPPTHAIPMLGM